MITPHAAKLFRVESKQIEVLPKLPPDLHIKQKMMFKDELD
jgi:hypothetical protein